MSLRIRKVKWNGDRLLVNYERARAGSDDDESGEPDEFSINCKDRPSPAFLSALQALEKDVNAICEFKPHAKLNVRAVSFSWSKGVMGAVITAHRSLGTAPSPLILNTPHLPAEPYGAGAGGQLMPAGMAERLRMLLEEVSRYVLGGAREQPGMPYGLEGAEGATH
jgi:hypothetical protein